MVGIDHAQIDTRFARTRGEVPCAVRHAQGQRVEKCVVQDVIAQTPQAGRQDLQQAMHAAGDQSQALGSVVDRVEARDHGQQHLRGADIAGGLLAADMLLTGL